MSWEAWGSDEPFDIEVLYRRGWESDPDAQQWWRKGEPETVYTLEQAIQIHEDSFQD